MLLSTWMPAKGRWALFCSCGSKLNPFSACIFYSTKPEVKNTNTGVKLTAKDRSSSKKAGKKSFTDSVLLPKTTFPQQIKQGETRNRHELQLQSDRHFDWQYRSQRLTQPSLLTQAVKSTEQADSSTGEFVLHDGPPYANGPCHIGHAVNKILKDIHNRYAVLQGKLVHYVPGWDCHGLPIELIALKRARSKKHSPTSTTVSSDNSMQIRNESYKFALESIEQQRQAFKRWAVMGDWSNTLPLRAGGSTYTTVSAAFEAMLLDTFYDLYERKLINRSFMPVYWSPSSQTALAEAELEYNDKHNSTAVIAKFELKNAPSQVLHATKSSKASLCSPKISLLIWTTTPWSLVANQAVCFNSAMSYVLIKDPTTAANAEQQQFLILAKSGLDFVARECDWPVVPDVISEFGGEVLSSASYNHPINQQKPPQPLLHAAHVLAGKGTGLVHCAPNHGHEDYIVFRQLNFPLAPLLVDDAGRFRGATNDDDIPEQLKGMHAMGEGTDAVVNMLRERNALLAVNDKYTHSYPYDWRTKKPVIIRSSQQWFFETSLIKDRALRHLEHDVRVVPEHHKRQLAAKLEQRPYWCISRQRRWGTPIPVFYAENDEPLCTKQSVQHLQQLFLVNGPDSHNGANVWWQTEGLDTLVSDDIRARAVRKGDDILDIWFESGATWRHVLPINKNTNKQVADFVCEGHDQIGAWFQTSLLLSTALQDCAPYRNVYVHGFVLDEHGRKMSKSVGNVVDPNDIVSVYGADVLRLLVARHVEPGINLTIGKAHVEQCEEVLRKWRNTLRFILGNIDADFCPAAAENDVKLTFIDKYMLYKIREFVAAAERHYEDWTLNLLMQDMLNFMSNTVSSLYFSVVKDRLYCSARTSPERRGVQYVLRQLLWNLSYVMLPIVPHLVEECCATYYKEHSNASEFVGSQNVPWKTNATEVASLQTWLAQNKQLFQPDSSVVGDTDRLESKMRLISTIRNAVNQLRDDNPLSYGLRLTFPHSTDHDWQFVRDLSATNDNSDEGCEELSDLLQVSQCFVGETEDASKNHFSARALQTGDGDADGGVEKIRSSEFSINIPVAHGNVEQLRGVLYKISDSCRCSRCNKYNVKCAIPHSQTSASVSGVGGGGPNLCGRCNRVLSKM